MGDRLIQLPAPKPALPKESRSLGAQIKQGFLNLCGRIYRFFAKSTTLEAAAQQGNIWLVRGFAFLGDLSQETMQRAVQIATYAKQWKVVQYFAECFGCYTMNKHRLTPLHELLSMIRTSSKEKVADFQKAALALIAVLPDEALQVEYLIDGFTPLRAATLLQQIAISKALVARDEKAAYKLAFELVEDPNTKPEQLKTLLEADVSANTCNLRDETLLAKAIEANRPDLVEVILKAGADVNLCSGQYNVHPLQAALSNTESLRQLLDNGASVEAVIHPKLGTALHMAMISNKPEAAALLLDRGAKNTQNAQGKTPLTLAYLISAAPPLDLCHRLIAMDENLPEPDEDGIALFQSMMGQDDFTGINLLIQKGIDIASFIEEVSQERDSAFVMKAYEQKHFDIVCRFLEKGRGFSAQNALGQNLMHMAARDNHRQIVDLLRSKGVSVMQGAHYDGRTPFQLALENGHISLAVSLAKESGVKATDLETLSSEPYRLFVKEAVNNGVFLPLEFIDAAMARKDLDLCDFLVEKDAGCKKPTLFKLALEKRDLVLAVKYAKGSGVTPRDLLSFSKDEYHLFVTWIVERQNFNPQLFLNTAIQRGDLGLVQFLVEKGADPLIAGKKSHNSFHVAALYDKTGQIMNYLASHYYQIYGNVSFMNALDEGGHTIIHLGAISGNDASIVAALTTICTHLDKPKVFHYLRTSSKGGETALSLARSQGHESTVGLLDSLLGSA